MIYETTDNQSDSENPEINSSQRLEAMYAIAGEDALISANHAREDEALKHSRTNQLCPAPYTSHPLSADDSEVCGLSERVSYTLLFLFSAETPDFRRQQYSGHCQWKNPG
jgi:hypothetical protein